MHHALDPAVGMIASTATAGDSNGHSSQILNQCQPHHEGQCPQLSQRQRNGRLVGCDKSVHAFRISATVCMCDQFQGNRVDPWLIGMLPLGKARKTGAVVRGQQSPRRSNLFFNEIEVVEQPY